MIDALIKKYRRPNLSDVRPNTMIEIAAQVVQTIENKAEFGVGPVNY
jgi:hypothetical protein